MTDKAYIVANEQQEREVLEKLEREGLVWNNGYKITEWVPSSVSYSDAQLPYVLVVDDGVYWIETSELTYEEIVYDGRKESKMKISKEVYDALVEWRDEYGLDAYSGRWAEFLGVSDLSEVPDAVVNWWIDKYMPVATNNRLIAILRWMNGEDVFEVEKPKKWVVRSKESDDDADYWYVALFDYNKFSTTINHLAVATKFDTKEEAQSWANAHQEVVSVEE